MKNKVQLSDVLTMDVYVQVKAQLKESLAKRCGAKAVSQLSLTKINPGTIRVCVSGKPRAYLNTDSDMALVDNQVVGACMLQMVGSATKQLIKVSAPVVQKAPAVVKPTARKGWSLSILAILTLGLGSITAAVAAVGGIL